MGEHYRQLSAKVTIDKYYKLSTDVILQECDFKGGTLGFITKEIDRNANFTIVGQTPDKQGWIISFGGWIPYDEATKLLSGSNNPIVLAKTGSGKIVENTMINDPQDDTAKSIDYNYYFETETTLKERYFIISKSDLDYQADVINTWLQPIAGSIVFPFKYRPQTKEFNKDITLSSLVGAKHQFNNFCVGVVVGIGISSVTVDSQSTNGITKKSTNLAAVTMPFGFIFEWKTIQFGVLGGLDWISDNSIYQWRYQGQPWIAIGLGISLFKNDLISKSGGTGKN